MSLSSVVNEHHFGSLCNELNFTFCSNKFYKHHDFIIISLTGLLLNHLELERTNLELIRLYPKSILHNI